MKMPSEKEYQLLAIVAVREVAGREVARRYKAETGKPISYGTLYTTFRRLKEQGWVDTRDDADQDGRVRYFHITGAGARILTTARQQYRELAAFAFRISGLPVK